MAKALGAAYQAGRRGGDRGWLSNVNLGTRDPEGGGFVMLGKTFKDITDAMLDWQTRELLAREIRRGGHVVYVRPELVAEVAFEGLQESPTYPGGLASGSRQAGALVARGRSRVRCLAAGEPGGTMAQARIDLRAPPWSKRPPDYATRSH